MPDTDKPRFTDDEVDVMGMVKTGRFSTFSANRNLSHDSAALHLIATGWLCVQGPPAGLVWAWTERAEAEFVALMLEDITVLGRDIAGELTAEALDDPAVRAMVGFLKVAGNIDEDVDRVLAETGISQAIDKAERERAQGDGA